ncbi:M23 family metallopeptidase [Methylobacterium oryzihabitans]|uniref:M23 family peptidase n=1 Tax=Methylobacterium oryzihabitans TaxID=2499852 RepID=A0A437P2T1_9HYPH|nr:M23 family metallopeptidase [Methylobacterium oryzihabitans]RVU16607.1 M23 family peptidase [Methylobacterium oryzihabitans]
MPASLAPPPSCWTVSRATIVAAGLLFAFLSAWAGAATWFIVFHDEALARFVARQSAAQYAYEERVSALRARLDRVATQKLLEQDGIEHRVADLASRQVELENRQEMLLGLAEPAGEAPPTPLPGPSRSAEPKPVPVPSSEPLGLRGDAGDERGAPSGLSLRIAGLEGAIADSAARQTRTLDRLRWRNRGELARLREVVAETGIDPGRFAPRPGGVGGPLVAVGTGPFEAAVAAAQVDLGALDALRRAVRALPLRRPTDGDAGLSSLYGYRTDPFTRALALHTGVDLRAEHGAAARAAAAGTVVAAEYSGGYGNMVEVDHGHGISTRYAHLSAIGVAPGQGVAAGQVVGRVGSTGRSTAPHLHYETRIDGDPVDPVRFLRASARFARGSPGSAAENLERP